MEKMDHTHLLTKVRQLQEQFEGKALGPAVDTCGEIRDVCEGLMREHGEDSDVGKKLKNIRGCATDTRKALQKGEHGEIPDQIKSMLMYLESIDGILRKTYQEVET